MAAQETTPQLNGLAPRGVIITDYFLGAHSSAEAQLIRDPLPDWACPSRGYSKDSRAPKTGFDEVCTYYMFPINGSFINSSSFPFDIWKAFLDLTLVF